MTHKFPIFRIARPADQAAIERAQTEVVNCNAILGKLWPPKEMVKKLLPRRLLGRLRVMRIKRMVSRYPRRQVRHTYGGFPLEIMLNDLLAQGWYDHDWPELREIAFLRRHRLKPGARVFNLGAHQGIVALMLSNIVRPNGLVVAVEGSPYNAAIAEINRNLNQAQQLIVLSAAVARKSGTLFFSETLNGQVDDGSGEWGRVQVPAVSIDELTRMHGRPDVLFMDVEGFECQALRGADETLASGPDCFVEVHVGVGLEKFGGSVDELISFFPRDRYEILCAPESGGEFAEFSRDSPVKERSFLLIAVGRQD